MLKLIASAIQGTVEDSTTTEEEILEALKKILQLLQQVDDKLDSSDPHNARSEGNGGIGSNSGYGGSFGNGGGSRADSLQRPTTIGLDVDGNAKDDYSLNLIDGNTHAVIGADGSVILTKRDNSTIPMPSDASKTGSASFDLDADNDGVDDVSMNSDSGANARFSVYEDEAWRSIAAKDPLGRTADELRALYEDRETIQLPERTTIQ